MPPAGHDPHDVLEHKDPISGKRPWSNATTNTALAPSIPTWPRVLATHDCAFIGKWHLGGHGAVDRQPAAFGFEELDYFDAGGSSYFNWRSEWNRSKPYYPNMTGIFRIGRAGPPSGCDYLTDDLSVRATRLIEGRSTTEKPFVLYYCPFAVHSPFQAPDEEVKRFSNKKQRGHLGHDNPAYAAMLKHLDD
jgi:arylsulfatase A-like enzyme